jgi:hypothetical protein
MSLPYLNSRGILSMVSTSINTKNGDGMQTAGIQTNKPYQWHSKAIFKDLDLSPPAIDG